MKHVSLRSLAALCAVLAAVPAAAQEAFDACNVFTQEDAQKVIGKEAEGEAPNPKAKKPKVVASCSYHATKDGHKVAATAAFRWSRNDEEAQRAFEDARMKLQTKPLLFAEAEAFWSAKTGELMLRKGRTWLTVAVGPAPVNQRDMSDARKLAEILARKM